MNHSTAPFRLAILSAFLVTTLLNVYPAHAQDPGLPDSLLIGCLDTLNREPIYVGLNQRVMIPVWWKSDDTVTFFHIPMACDNRYFVSLAGGPIYEPFSLFDDIGFLHSDTSSPEPGFTSQSLLGFLYLRTQLDDPRDVIFPILNGNGWVRVCDLILTTTSDTAALGDTTAIREGYNPANGSLLFGLIDGETGFRPGALWGKLRFATFIPGDANGTGDVNGLDVVYLVNFLKGAGPAPDPILRGDANGDCAVNGLDVIYLVNFFKGSGPAPVWGECP